ncbi:MAG: nucleotidyltransferase [Flavobacteriaceae bacterium]|nr:nucleotidyltransferase [Flavobacteriaceae bacterium]
MPKISEETLKNWIKPPSDTEETKLSNAERMVREAITEDEKLGKKSTETFGQGSYANNTNVKIDSDIDINVRYTGGFYFDLPKDTEEEDVGLDKLSGSKYTYSKFKDHVERALVNKFGKSEVIRNDKCITIIGNSYRVETDVVPTWNHRQYYKNGNYVLGAQFKTDNGKWILNYPKQHLENGIDKNNNTYRRFKRLTRIHKRLRNKMIQDGIDIDDCIKSFLIESLVWNVPNKIFNDYDTWDERLKQSIIYLYEKTKNRDDCKEWGEVSELLYLFHSSKKWSRSNVNEYLVQAWSYLEY